MGWKCLQEARNVGSGPCKSVIELSEIRTCEPLVSSDG